MSDQDFNARVDAMLAQALEHPPGTDRVEPAPPITTGTTALGLRWAAAGGYRVMAYRSIGYAAQRWDEGMRCWLCMYPTQQMPAEIERALCATLGIDFQAD